MRKLILTTLIVAAAAPLGLAQAKSGEVERRYQDELRERREAERQRFEGERRQWEQRRQLHERQRERIQASGRWNEAYRLRWESERERLETDRQAMEQRRNRREEAFNRAQDARNDASVRAGVRPYAAERPRPPSPPRPATAAPPAFPQSYAGARNAAQEGMRPARRLGQEDRVYRGPSGRYYCRRPDGTTGAIVISDRAATLIGAVIAPGSSRTIGALTRAADRPIRRAIDREGVGCR